MDTYAPRPSLTRYSAAQLMRTPLSVGHFVMRSYSLLVSDQLMIRQLYVCSKSSIGDGTSLAQLQTSDHLSCNLFSLTTFAFCNIC